MGLNTASEFIALIFPLFLSFIYFFHKAWEIDYTGIDTYQQLITQWFLQFTNFAGALFFYYLFAGTISSMVETLELNSEFVVITNQLFVFGFLLILANSLIILYGTYKFMMIGLNEFERERKR